LIYLLDANTLITAKNSYYPINRIPEYWDWLIHCGQNGTVKVVTEIYDELRDGGTDELSLWAEQQQVRDALLLQESADQTLVSQVVYGGYLSNPTENDMVRMGQDPFLISYALKDPENRCIVTSEVSKPSRKGANRHIPDVCNALGVQCIDGHHLIIELDFSTSWKTGGLI